MNHIREVVIYKIFKLGSRHPRKHPLYQTSPQNKIPVGRDFPKHLGGSKTVRGQSEGFCAPGI
jgi:hypothetical protein